MESGLTTNWHLLETLVPAFDDLSLVKVELESVFLIKDETVRFQRSLVGNGGEITSLTSGIFLVALLDFNKVGWDFFHS